MAVVPQFALVINYPRLGGGGGGFGGFQQPTNLSDTLTANERQLDQIRRMLRDAEAYGRARDAYAKDKALPRRTKTLFLSRSFRTSVVNSRSSFEQTARLKFAVRSSSLKR